MNGLALRPAGVFLLSLMVMSIGCRTITDEERTAITEETVQRPSHALKTLLRCGDTVEVRFFYTPQLDTVQTVRPDGCITLQLVGEVVAEGKEPEQLKKELVELFTGRLEELEIAVIVQATADRYVYVGGRVNNPGRIVFNEQLTVLQAVLRVGGFRSEGISDRPRNATVIRFLEGKCIRYKVELPKLIQGTSDDTFFLEPEDVVYVP